MNSIVPTRAVLCYPNNKPWVTRDIKVILKEMKMAFRTGNREGLRPLKGELKVRIREAKEKYRKNLEWKLQENNLREVWSGMRTLTGFKTNNNRGVEGRFDRANELNLFFNKFDTVGQAHLPSNSSD